MPVDTLARDILLELGLAPFRTLAAPALDMGTLLALQWAYPGVMMPGAGPLTTAAAAPSVTSVTSPVQGRTTRTVALPSDSSRDLVVADLASRFFPDANTMSSLLTGGREVFGLGAGGGQLFSGTAPQVAAASEAMLGALEAGATTEAAIQGGVLAAEQAAPLMSGVGTGLGVLGLGLSTAEMIREPSPQAGAGMVGSGLALAGYPGVGALFTVPALIGAFDAMSRAKADAERQKARIGPTREQAAMYSAPLGLPIDQMLQDPVFHRTVRLAQQANQGGLQNDIRVGPDIYSQQFLDQVKRIPNFAIMPDPLGPTDLEMIGNLPAVGTSLQGLIRQYSDRLAEAGYAPNPRIADAPGWERPQLLYDENGRVTGAAAFDEHGRPRTEWGQNVPVPLAMPTSASAGLLERVRPVYAELADRLQTGGRGFSEWADREAVLDWLGATASANKYNPEWRFTPEEIGRAVPILGRASIDPYRAEWEEVRQGGGGGTTAKSLEEYAFRQIGYGRR